MGKKSKPRNKQCKRPPPPLSAAVAQASNEPSPAGVVSFTPTVQHETLEHLFHLYDILSKLEHTEHHRPCFWLAQYISSCDTFDQLPLTCHAIVYSLYARGQWDIGHGDRGVAKARFALQAGKEVQAIGQELKLPDASHTIKHLEECLALCEADFKSLGKGSDEVPPPLPVGREYEYFCNLHVQLDTLARNPTARNVVPLLQRLSMKGIL